MQRRAIFFPARAILQHPLQEDTARARGKKAVILAMRYFNAAARDALSCANSNNGRCTSAMEIIKTCYRVRLVHVHAYPLSSFSLPPLNRWGVGQQNGV
jgi:hypothetical protein